VDQDWQDLTNFHPGLMKEQPSNPGQESVLLEPTPLLGLLSLLSLFKLSHLDRRLRREVWLLPPQNVQHAAQPDDGVGPRSSSSFHFTLCKCKPASTLLFGGNRQDFPHFEAGLAVRSLS